MTIHNWIQITRIPLIVVLWERERFQGRKRTFPVVTQLKVFESPPPPPVLVDATQNQFNAVRDLGFMDFDDTTHAIGIHAGPSFKVDEAIVATVSFFEDPNWGGTEIALAPGNHANLKAYGFEGKISSWRYNPPGTRQAGWYEDGRLVTPYETGAPPSALISPIHLVVQIFRGDGGYVTDALTNYSNGCDNNQRCISLVEDSLDLGLDFGPEFDGHSRAVVVWRGPDYNNATEDPNNWQARLYKEPTSADALKAGQSPAFKDLSPRVTLYPNPPYSTAEGVFPGPTHVGIDARGVKFVIPGRT